MARVTNQDRALIDIVARKAATRTPVDVVLVVETSALRVKLRYLVTHDGGWNVAGGAKQENTAGEEGKVGRR